MYFMCRFLTPHMYVDILRVLHSPSFINLAQSAEKNILDSHYAEFCLKTICRIAIVQENHKEAVSAPIGNGVKVVHIEFALNRFRLLMSLC